MIKIRHQLFFKGSKSDKLLMETFAEHDMTLEDLAQPVKQMGLINWEKENMINPNVYVKRKVFDDDEWEEAIENSKNWL